MAHGCAGSCFNEVAAALLWARLVLRNGADRHVRAGAPLVAAATHLAAAAVGAAAALSARRFLWPRRHFLAIWRLSRRNHYSLRPTGVSADCVLRRPGFCLGFSPEHRAPAWASFIICRESLALYRKRDDNARNEAFFADRDVPPTARTTPQDFLNTGFDKGHLAPRASIAFSPTSAKDSFALTNVALQHPRLNRGPWKTLEWCTRRWAAARDGWTGVVVGTVFASGDGDAAHEVPRRVRGIAVPTHFYMAVIDFATRNAIGFLMANADPPAGVVAASPAALVKHHALSLHALEAKLSQLSARRITLFRRLPYRVRPVRVPSFLGLLPGCDRHARRVDRDFWLSGLAVAAADSNGSVGGSTAPAWKAPPLLRARRKKRAQK